MTLPAQLYAANGERCSFALLRLNVDLSAQDKIRQLVLDAYAEYEDRTAVNG